MLEFLQVGGLDGQGIAQQGRGVGHRIALGQEGPGRGHSQQKGEYEGYGTSPPALAFCHALLSRWADFGTTKRPLGWCCWGGFR